MVALYGVAKLSKSDTQTKCKNDHSWECLQKNYSKPYLSFIDNNLVKFCILNVRHFYVIVM